ILRCNLLISKHLQQHQKQSARQTAQIDFSTPYISRGIEIPRGLAPLPPGPHKKQTHMNENTPADTNPTMPNPPSIALAKEDPSSIALLAKEGTPDSRPAPAIPDIPDSALCTL